MIDLDAIEARVQAVPYDVIPHGPQTGDRLLICFTDADDTNVGRLYGPHQVEIANLLAHARQDIPALVAEVRRLRASAIPSRLTLPDGSTAEIVDVRVRRTLRTGGSWHEMMSVASWRGLRQEEGREVLRDRGGETE